jgi:hypothetical protein
MNSAQFSLIHYKTNEAYTHVLSEKALTDLENLNDEFKIVFDKYNYQYLFG